MFTLKKDPARDYKILNLTDTQMRNDDWEEDRVRRKVLDYTVEELVKRTSPDLITISGDIAGVGRIPSYTMFADLMESFGIPWAPVWGNHDIDEVENMDKVADLFLSYPHCIFEKGEREMGHGNYIISIEENGTPVHALFMMDSHDGGGFWAPDGSRVHGSDKLWDNQLYWLAEQNEMLRSRGCRDTSLHIHQPIRAYKHAWEAAFREGFDRREISVEDTYTGECWRDGYKDSFGVCREGVSCHPLEDGVLEALIDGGTTRHVFCGHDHCNNFSIKYHGVRLTYNMKTGCGSAWKEDTNGGTLITVGSDGIKDVRHEYIDVSHLVEE
ncbi:MAG: hypothetical protein E7672_00655 [Ruminococcaceae bacterium]|nr:hypothetical protein [Oscillospiraceae bacterium]